MIRIQKILESLCQGILRDHSLRLISISASSESALEASLGSLGASKCNIFATFCNVVLVNLLHGCHDLHGWELLFQQIFTSTKITAPQELDQLLLRSSSPVVVRREYSQNAHGLGQVECTLKDPSNKKMRFLQDRLSLVISSSQDSSVIPSQPISFRHRLVSQGILQGSAWCKQISTDFNRFLGNSRLINQRLP